MVERQRPRQPSFQRHREGAAQSARVRQPGREEHDAARVRCPGDDLLGAAARGVEGEAPRRAAGGGDEVDVAGAAAACRERDPASVGRVARRQHGVLTMDQARSRAAAQRGGPEVAAPRRRRTSPRRSGSASWVPGQPAPQAPTCRPREGRPRGSGQIHGGQGGPISFDSSVSIRAGSGAFGRCSRRPGAGPPQPAIGREIVIETDFTSLLHRIQILSRCCLTRPKN